MNRKVKITVAEPSDIIRGGITTILRQASRLHADIMEVSEPDQLRTSLGWQKPDILIINPSLMGLFPLQQARKDAANPDMKCVALQVSLADASSLRAYDETVSVYDNAEQVVEKIVRLTDESEEADKRHESLSQREKEVIACVVRGMTNKQIADKLCLSAHTVITHRRNISAKLDIHSTAGLTIYAIVNKLIEIDDIKSGEQSEE